MLSGDFESYRYTLPTDLISTQWNILTLEFSRLDSPNSLGISPDRRRLAAYVKQLRFEYSISGEDHDSHEKEGQSGIIGDSCILPPLSQLIIPMDPPSVFSVHLEIHTMDERDSSFSVRIEQDNPSHPEKSTG